MTCTKSACSCLNIIFSILLSGLVGVLFAYEYIPFIITAVWIVFGLSILTLHFLISTIFISDFNGSKFLKSGIKSSMPCLAIGIFGSIISSIIVLSINLSISFLSSTIFVSLLTFFFVIMFIGLIKYIYYTTYNLEE